MSKRWYRALKYAVAAISIGGMILTSTACQNNNQGTTGKSSEQQEVTGKDDEKQKVQDEEEIEPSEKQEVVEVNEYEEDAMKLIKIVEESHPCFALNEIPEQYEAQKDSYIEAVKKGVTLEEFEMLTKKYLTTFNDGHTKASSGTPSKFLDLEGYVEEGKFFLTNQDGKATGEQLVSIDGRPIEEIFSIVKEYVPAENEAALADNEATYGLSSMILKYAACHVANEALPVEILADGKIETKEVKFVEKNLGDVYNYDKEMSSEMIDDIYYLDINTFMMDKALLQEESDKLEKAIHSGVKKVIIDVRDNGGGMFPYSEKIFNAMGMIAPSYGAHLRYSLWTIIYRNSYKSEGMDQIELDLSNVVRNEQVHLVVLENKNTFSAATMFGTVVQDGKLGVVIGRPSVNAPSCYSDIMALQLDHSKLNVQISTSKVVRPDAQADQTTLVPDILVDRNEDILQVAVDYLKNME